MSQIVSQPINEEWTTSVRSLESHSRQRLLLELANAKVSV